MIYCDTSLIVSALTAETGSAESRRWIGTLSDQLAVSWWTETEVAAALATKHRRELLSPAARMLVNTAWRRMLDHSLVLLAVEPRDYARAATLVDTDPGLRAGDALHLAIAIRHGIALATRDFDLAAATRASGLVAHLLSGT